MINFNADEIFEMAEKIERTGAKFYRIAADSAGGDTRDLLLRLAAIEEIHEKTFAAMRNELTDAEKLYTTPDPDSEVALYLQAMTDGKVFASDPTEALSGTESVEEVLKTAIDLEKDSIVFYQSMKEVVPEALGRERLDGIIKQEIGHILDLTKHLEAVKK